MKNEFYELIYINQTDKAILVSEDDPDEGIWLPKSQIEYDENEIDCADKGEEIEIGIPEWLAEQEGLI